MNKYIYAGLGFLAGGIAGALGAKLYFEKRYADLADKEIDEVKQMYLEKELALKEEAPNKKKTPAKKKSAKPKKEEKKESPKQKVNYNNISSGKEEELAENESPKEDEPMEPYEITFEEFEDEHVEYDKINLSYYDEDGTLVTDDEELVEADDTIGVENLDKFVEEEMNEMYIRNPSISTDYDIILVYGNYGKMIGM